MKDRLPLNFGFFSKIFKIWLIFQLAHFGVLNVFICEVVVVVWSVFTNCTFLFSVSSNFIVISACCSLSNSFRISISGSRIKDGSDDHFSCYFCSCGVKVIIKTFVIFVFL